jgi:protein involved in polysaccharide export with SLBB domain
MKSIKKLSCLLVSVLPLLVGGCIGLIPSPFRPSPGPTKSVQMEDIAQAFDIVCRNYRLGPSDLLQINYQTDWAVPAGTYSIDTRDELDPELNRDVVVRPDGMITLPGIGDVKARGLTPPQLSAELERRYRKANIFRENGLTAKLSEYKLVTVSVARFYKRIDQLAESLRAWGTGTRLNLILVKPDGTIDLPLLKHRILAAGQTVKAVESTANRLYRHHVLKGVVVSMSLQEARSRRFYVLGQVGSPGAYDLSQPITVTHAIAMAGGHLSDTADLTSVMLISKNIHGKPIARRLDLKRMLDVGDMSSTILVKPYDVIYVPKTYIRDIELFVQQYVGTARNVVEFVNLF